VISAPAKRGLGQVTFATPWNTTREVLSRDADAFFS
jgi:hypothetical protein